MQFLFSICLFFSAFLLFAIQPMVGKILLPLYGGTPTVWTICMVFFQLLLLAAYGYTWILSRFKGNKLWRLLHLFILLISLSQFPLHLIPTVSNDSPDFSILFLLIKQLGLPLLIVASSSPLLQFAYSQTQSKRAADPYFLYVASNLGSLLALISYPFLIERYTGLRQQLFFWNLAFGFYVGLLLLLLFFGRYQRNLTKAITKAHVAWSSVFSWVAYSFISCSLMLGVTFYITTDTAATPLFWILPLSLYLLSFIITFAKKPLISHTWVERNILFALIFPLLGFIFGANALHSWELILFHLAAFFMAALFCHGELVQRRPFVNQLTSFYLAIALGGVLAGLFNGIIAPRFFNEAYEYPLTLLLIMAVLPLSKKNSLGYLPFVITSLLLINYFLPAHEKWVNFIKEKHCLEILVLILILIVSANKKTLVSSTVILFVFLFSPWFKLGTTLAQTRNFYGVKKVMFSSNITVLISHNTVHGWEKKGKLTSENGAMAYYASVLPIVQHLAKTTHSLQAVIVGLGTGMMACQFNSSDKLIFIDIDKQVIDIAKNKHFFRYLQECPPQVTVKQGDGRLLLQTFPDASSDLLIIDAFSSDAIPTHLLTMEAFTVYKNKIKPSGIIMTHISNRYLHLLPVLTSVGRKLELIVLHRQQPAKEEKGQLSAEWVLLTTNEFLAMQLIQQEGWRFVTEGGNQLWTDDFSNLIPLLKW